MNMADHIAAERITGAIARMFIERGDACLREFTLRSRRRVDLIAIGSSGEITIVEVKSSRQDFISDRKWQEYPEWADRFYFAVAHWFPRDLLPGPDESGIIITDGFDCLEVQPAPVAKLAGQRRNHLTRRLAHVAMRRIEFGIAAGLDVEIDELMADDAAGPLPAGP